MGSLPPAPVVVDLLGDELVLVDLVSVAAVGVALEVLLPPGAAGVVAHVLVDGRPVQRVRVGVA